MDSERKKLPRILKEAVRERQKGKCVCCLNPGQHFHHLLAYSLCQEHHINNIFLLCKKHHNLFHLGDPETFQSVYEYAWYVQNGKLPENKDLIEISQEAFNRLSIQ